MTNIYKIRLGVVLILILAASVFFGIINQDRGSDFFLGATPGNQGGRPIGSQSEHDRRSRSDSDQQGTRAKQTALSRVMEAEYRIQNAADTRKGPVPWFSRAGEIRRRWPFLTGR